jgi:hypothetical protein
LSAFVILSAAAPTMGQVPSGETATLAAALPPGAVWAREADGRVVVRATRVTEPPRLDSRLDDEAYREVPAITEMIQATPVPGAPGTDRTEAWVLFDDENVYISVRCWQDPARIVGNDMRRDNNNISRHDHVAIAFDTFYDGRNGYQFNISAAGGLRDGLVTNERYDANWNGVWDGAAGQFEGGWTAELAIPFKTLRYAPGRSQTWHLQIRRFLAAKNETVYLTPLPPQLGIAGTNRYVLAATMVGLEAPPSGLNLEFKPYAISGVATDNLAATPFTNDLDGDAGFDGRYALTQGLAADFTYRTDFAQVEADEQQVNLTRFSIAFPEKREFFLENQGLFTFGSGGSGDVGGRIVPNIFYTRRIGLAGQRAVPVIGGGRVAGKAGLWSIGALNMTTDEDLTAGVKRTNFTVLRLRRDILGRSNVGGIFTYRDVSTAAPGANAVFGVDSNFAFGDNVSFSGYVARSQTEGWDDDPVRDGGDLSYRAQFNYNADRYGLALDRLVVEPNFNPEAGFMRRENFRRNFVSARFSPRTANHPTVRRWVYEGSLDYVTDNPTAERDARLESRSITGAFQTELHSSDLFSVQYERLYELLVSSFRVASQAMVDGVRRDVRIPAGGYGFDNVTVSYTLGAQHRVSGTPSFEIGSFYTGTKKAIGYQGRLEMGPRVGIEPNVSLNWIDLPEGSFRDTLLSARTSFTMTPRMFVAALVQYSSANNSTSTNLRFRWEYQAGSELFLVYTEGRSTLEEPLRPLDRFGARTSLQNRGFVVKINRLFRL